MGGFPSDVISPPTTLDPCVNVRGVGTSRIDGSSHISWVQLVESSTYIRIQVVR
jgi:hypothetical protein